MLNLEISTSYDYENDSGTCRKICKRLICAFSINVSLSSVDLSSVASEPWCRSTLFLLKDRHSDVLSPRFSPSVYVEGRSRREMQDRRWLSGVSRCFKPAAWREIRSREILPQMRTRDHGINRYVAGAEFNAFDSASNSSFLVAIRSFTNMLKIICSASCN